MHSTCYIILPHREAVKASEECEEYEIYEEYREYMEKVMAPYFIGDSADASSEKNGWKDYVPEDLSKTGRQLFSRPAFSIITPDGVWHSMRDLGYKPELDFQKGSLHWKNTFPALRWKRFSDKTCRTYGDYRFAVIEIES